MFYGGLMEISVLNVSEITNNDMYFLLKGFSPYYKCFLNSMNIFFTEYENKNDNYTYITNFLFVPSFINKNLLYISSPSQKTNNSKRVIINIDYIKNFFNYSGRNIMDPNIERLIEFEKLLKRLKIRIKKTKDSNDLLNREEKS